MSSATGTLFSTLMFLNIWSAKPHFLAMRYITSRSSFDSKIGLTICSPHWSARFEATREPLHSNWVATGSRYIFSLRPACTASDAQVVGCGSATTNNSSALRPFIDSGMRVMLLLAWPCTKTAHIVFLRDLILRQDRGVEPAGERDAGRFHDLLFIETADQVVVVNFPDPRPVLPRAFGQPVVEGQRHDIEADVGRTLHVVVAAEDVRAGAGPADISGEQQKNAARAYVSGAHRVLRLTHAPDQRGWPLRGEHFRNALDLSAGNPGDSFHLFGIPFLHFLARILEAIDALADEFLVLPSVLDDVPHDSVQQRNVGAGPYPDIFGGVGRRPRQARIDDDDIGLLKLGSFDQVLQRHRVRFRRIAAHDDLGLGVADVGVTVGHRAVAPCIGHAGDGGRMADARLVIGVVGAPERS